MKIKLSHVVSGALMLSIITGLTGCGASGKQFTEFKKPTDGNGMVYVYRPSGFIGAAVYYDVKDETNNDNVLGTLRNGGYIYQEMAPGKRVLWAKTEARHSVPVTVKENEVSCVKGSVGMGILVGRPELINVDRATCELEIKETKESLE